MVVMTRTTYAHLTMSECLHIAVLNDSVKKEAKTNRQHCPVCKKTTLVVQVSPHNDLANPLSISEICYDCKFKINNDFRQQVRVRPSALKHAHTVSGRQEAVFLEIGLFPPGPTLHGFCLSVYHQLFGTGLVCNQTHNQ